MKKHKTYIVSGALGLMVLLNACRVGKPYIRPQFDLPEEYVLQDSAKNASKGIIPWKDFFHDSVLKKLIDTAVVQNFDMRKALKNVEIADQYYRQSKAAFLPSFSLDLLGISRQYRSKNFYSTPSSNWYEHKNESAPDVMFNYQSQFSNTVNMSWELDIWGKLRWQREDARARYLQTYEAQRVIQTGLIAAISDNYYSLLMLDEQLEVAKSSYNLRNSNLKMVELQYESGEVTALAVQQTRTQMLEAAALIPKLEEEIAVHQNGLLLLTGGLSGEIERAIHISAIDIDEEYNVLFDLPLSVVQNRPDVLMSELRLKSANAKAGVAQAYQYPNLTISLAGGTNSMLAQNWFNIPGALFGGFTTGLAQPLFNRRKLKTNLEVARLEREKAEIDFQQTVYEAITETNNTLISINKMREQFTISEEQVSAARKAVENADLLFKAGFATYLEVINAQRNLLDAELEMVNIKANILIARVQLYRALGGGWQ